MPCDTVAKTPSAQQQQKAALDRLQKALGSSVSVVIGAQGAIAFRGWRDQDRGGLSDLCAYRKLAARNSPELRRAIARAEAVAGRKLDQQTVAAGVHSHDGGRTFGAHALAAAIGVALLAPELVHAHPGHGEAVHAHPELAALLAVVGAIAGLLLTKK